MIAIELKPCAFCRGTKISAYEGSTHRWGYLACDNCGANKGDCRKADIALPATDPVNVAAFAADWNDRELAQQARLPCVVQRALEALEAAQKHHTTTSLPLAIERFGSLEAAGEFGRKTWQELVPQSIEALKVLAPASTAAGEAICDEHGNFNTEDPDLSFLLSFGGDLASGEANMDTALWFMDMLEKVQARLLPAGRREELLALLQHAAVGVRYCVDHHGADLHGLLFRLEKAVMDLGGQVISNSGEPMRAGVPMRMLTEREVLAITGKPNYTECVQQEFCRANGLTIESLETQNNG